ncbi:MAG: class I SAM-dependent methyltransferase, partial [Chloroflexi bacterium]
WPAELDFYLKFASGRKILEVACGTGRITIPLARAGAHITGLDLSPAMLEVARRKSAGLEHLRWVEAGMRNFDLGEQFDLIISPGHSFQFMLTAAEQLECLETLKRHLAPGGTLILHLDHQDLAWLGEVGGEKAGIFQQGSDVSLPTGQRLRLFHSWAYDRATQTATADKYYEELGPGGEALKRLERGPLRLHCVFRTEMEHLLARAGLETLALYGDFERHPLQNSSSEMIWVVTLKGNAETR